MNPILPANLAYLVALSEADFRAAFSAAYAEASAAEDAFTEALRANKVDRYSRAARTKCAASYWRKVNADMAMGLMWEASRARDRSKLNVLDASAVRARPGPAAPEAGRKAGPPAAGAAPVGKKGA